MIKAWVLLVFWTPSNGLAVDLSVVTTGREAYGTYDECQQARAVIVAIAVADRRKVLSRCDELAVGLRGGVR